MNIEEQFKEAVGSSKTLSSKPDNETLLKLYSLYKQSTEGDNTGSEPANPFDFIAKAKHNAWLELQGKSQEDAMKEYVDLVNQLKG